MTRTRATSSLLATLALATALGRAARADDPPPPPASAPEPLWKAAKAGLVAVQGRSLGSYTQARLAIASRSKVAVTVDVNGSYLEPRTTSVQPLGLGVTATRSKDTTVTIPAGQTVTVDFLSVCMAASAHSPDGATAFTLAEREPPADTLRLMRHWRAHPEMDQSRIQAAVWNHGEDPSPDAPTRPAPDDMDLPAGAKKIGVVWGAAYVLEPTGDLLRGSPGERFARIATGVVDIFVEGANVHALCVGSPVPGATRERRPCVARYEAERDRWTLEVETVRASALRWAKDGAALVNDGAALRLLVAGRARQVGAADDAVVPTDGGALVVSEGAGSSRILRLGISWTKVTTDALDVGAALRTVALFEGTLLGIARTSDALLAIDDAGTARRIHLSSDRPLTAAELMQGASPELRARSLRTVRGGVLLVTEHGPMIRGAGAEPRHLPPVTGASFETDGATGTIYAVSGERLSRFDANATSWVPVRFKRPETAGP